MGKISPYQNSCFHKAGTVMDMTCDLLLHAACVVTQDDARSVLENASLAVRAGDIVGMGPRPRMEQHWRPEKVLDMGHALVMPGLINTHAHCSMTLLRGFADDLPLMEWLNTHIFPVEQHLTPEIVEWGALLGMAEMLRTGTTSVQDMYIIEDAVLRACATSGMRCTAGEAIFSFPSAGGGSPEETLDSMRALAETWRGHERVRLAVCPHSVYTTTPDILDRCRDAADELGLPLHLHLSETTAETAQCLATWGKRPIPYCHERHLLRPSTTLAHVVDADEADMEILATTGATVVHNPSSNMKLASGVAPVSRMQALGIRTALGTDGAASNNRLNMFTEMGRCALLHKVAGMDPTLLPAQSVLDMATRNGAEALLQPRLGRLAVGHPADLTALDLDAPNLQPLYTPVSHLVYAATGMEVRMTMVAGEVLYLDGAYTRFDYPALQREISALRGWVRGRK